MTSSSEDDLRLEVEELTTMLRSSEDWEEQRRFVLSQGLDPRRVALASFHEDESGGEFGLVVASDGAFEYARRIEGVSQPAAVLRWERCSDDQLAAEYPQYPFAIELLARESLG